MRPALLFVVPSVLAILACSGGKNSDTTKADEAAPVKVETATVTTRPMPTWLTLTGTVVADKQVQVAADANGVVVTTNAERGQAVKKGEELVVVDTRLSALQATAGSAQAAALAAQLTAADKECERAAQLLKDGVISQSTYDRTVATCAAQARSLDAAKASAEMAGTTLAKSRIRAPFDGVVGERMVEVGAFVGSASPVATVYATDTLRVRFAVPEAHVGLVADGQAVRFNVSAYPDREFTGVVRYVSPALREQTRDLVVEAVADNPDGALRPGMFAAIRLAAATSPTPVVPTDAVRGQDTVHTVFTVREGRAFANIVRVGSEEEGYTAVLTDLADGDVVVVHPPDALHDGGRVETATATAGKAE